MGRHQKIEEKLRRLGNANGNKKEVYVERKFKEKDTGTTTSNIWDLLKTNQVSLLQGAAGAGKSSVAAKALKRWSESEEEMDGASCFLFLSAGSEEKVPLYKLIWDEHENFFDRTDGELKDAYQYI